MGETSGNSGADLPMRSSRLATLVVLVALLCNQYLIAFGQSDEIKRLERRVIELRDQSKWPEAMPVAEQAATLVAAKYGENHTNTADALHTWAWLVQQNGDDIKAEKLWLRALAIDEALFGKDACETTRRLHLLSTVYLDRRDFQSATPLLERALRIRENCLGPDDHETAQVVRSIGRCQLLSGDLAAAETSFLRAAAIYEKKGASSRSPLAATFSSLGWLYLILGDYDKALTMVTRSLQLRKALFGPEHVVTASNLRELALIHKGRGELDMAERRLEESIAIMQRLLGEEHLFVAETLEELGMVLLKKGDVAKAEEALKRAHRNIEKTLGSASPRAASIFSSLSAMEERSGNYQKARQLCEHAYQMRVASLGAFHSSTLGNLRHLACLDAALGHPDRALAVADRLQEGEARVLDNVLSFTSERQRLANQRESALFKHRYDLWATLGAARPLARSALRTKGIVLDSLIEDRLLARVEDAGVRELVTQITEARRQLAQLMPEIAQAPPPTNLNAELQSVSGRIESLENALARRVAGLGRARRSLGVQFEQVQSAVPANAVLLEMLRYREYTGRGHWRESYGALIVSRANEPHWVPLGPADDLEKAVQLYKHAVRISEAPDALTRALEDLYTRIWRPLLPKLPERTSQVIVSPDGQLNFVSFAALLSPAGRFLGEEHLFSYVSSGRDLLADTKPEPASGQLVIWANPDFGGSTPVSRPGSSEGTAVRTRQSAVSGTPTPSGTTDEAGADCGRRDLSFRPLPGAEKEGRLLHAQARQLGFVDAVLHVGDQATEAKLHRLKSPSALHLATHGFMLPQIELPPGTMGESEFSGSETFVLPTLNPMLRCGLALAGAQHTLRAWRDGQSLPTHDDGIVTADEIGTIDLHGTQLVVLSACDTGTGEARAGEGVLGLRRGFIQAGAKNLLLTLWPIDDAEIGGFMPDFYVAMHKKASPSRALAEVQRAWLRRLRSERGAAEACRIAGPFILSFQGTKGL